MNGKERVIALFEQPDNTIWYVLGFILGMVVGLLLVVLIVKVIHKAGGRVDLKWSRNGKNFDERQQLARGVAYKWAFYTLIIYLLAVSLMNDFEVTRIFMSFAGIWIGVCIAILVFAIICIKKDAYMSLYENAKGVIMLFSTVGILNMLVSIRVFTKHLSFLENGVIAIYWVNAIVAILFLAITVMFGIKVAYNNKHIEDED